MTEIDQFKSTLNEQIWVAFTEVEKLENILNNEIATKYIPMETLVMINSDVTRFRIKFRILQKVLGDEIDIITMAEQIKNKGK